MDAPQLLADRVALVTGAAGDIGIAIAARFAEAGARLALLDLKREQLQERVAELGVDAGRVLADQCNVADPEQTRRAVEACVARFGAVDILVNNAAAVTALAPTADVDVQAWNIALAVNLTGAFLMSKWCIAAMRRQRRGVIINVASQLGHVTTPGRAPYSASKAGLLSLTRTIALDHAADGIRAVSLSPGAVLTSRLTATLGEAEAVQNALWPDYPIGRLGTPREIAEAVLYLASDHAGFITGSDLLVDGGYTAR